MEIIFFILVFLAALVYAYFFPKGVKIFGIPAEQIFRKQEDGSNGGKPKEY